MKYPWIAWYPAEYISKTRSLTMKQHGAYSLLLWEYYTNGPLVANATALLNVCGAKTEEDREDVVYILKTFFTFENGFYHHKRADEEIDKRSSISKQRQLLGRKGGLAKASRLLQQNASKTLACLQSHNTQVQEKPIGGLVVPYNEAIAKQKLEIQNHPPEGLHPTNYVAKLLEDLVIPQTPNNFKIVAACIEAEIKSGKTGASAYEFILAGCQDARDEGYEINTFFFNDARYRTENRHATNGHGKQNTLAERNKRAFDEAMGRTPKQN